MQMAEMVLTRPLTMHVQLRYIPILNLHNSVDGVGPVSPKLQMRKLRLLESGGLLRATWVRSEKARI